MVNGFYTEVARVVGTTKQRVSITLEWLMRQLVGVIRVEKHNKICAAIPRAVTAVALDCFSRVGLKARGLLWGLPWVARRTFCFCGRTLDARSGGNVRFHEKGALIQGRGTSFTHSKGVIFFITFFNFFLSFFLNSLSTYN